MGEYINPRSITKEEFLDAYGKEMTKEFFLATSFRTLENENKMAVIIVDNMLFTAALKLHNQSEFLYIRTIIKNDAEKRPYKLYIVKHKNFKHAEQ